MLKILVASVSNTGMQVGQHLYKYLKKYSKVSYMSIDQYAIQNLLDQEYPVVLILATTGDGQCPKVYQEFWNILLIKNHPKDLLKGKTFAILGLGDSKYDKYNYVARKTKARLQMLSADISVYLLADQQHPSGYLTICNKFQTLVLSQVQQNCKLKTLFSEQVHQIKYKQIEIDQQQISKEIQSLQISIQGKLYVKHKSQLFYKGDVRTIMLTFQSQSINFADYQVLQIFPPLADQNLRFLFKKLQLLPSTPIQYKGKNITALQLLKWRLQMYPTRCFIQRLKQKTNDQIHKQGLNMDQQKYYQYIRKSRRTIIEVLKDFWSVQLDIQDLIDTLLPKYSRFYSISNYHQSCPRLLLRIKPLRINQNRSILGFASTFFNHCKGFILARGSKSQIDLIQGCNNYLLIGGGVGIAPFFRMFQKSIQKNLDAKFLLFYGCRFKQQIYLEQQLNNFSEKGILKYYVAVSQQKIHIQDIISNHMDQITQFVNRQNVKVMLVCPIGMCKYVKEIIKKVSPNVQVIIEPW